MRKRILFAIIAMLLFASGVSVLAKPYAVYCDKDKSLHFLDSETQLSVGQKLPSNGQAITQLWEIDLDPPANPEGIPPEWWTQSEDVTTVIIEPSFNTVNPTSCYRWFYGLKSLNDIEGLANLNTERVTDMSFMFEGCRALTSLDLSRFNTERVTDMSGMFYGCTSLTSLDLSSFKTKNVTDMAFMFEYCNALTSLDLSSFNTENVTDMREMFCGCTSLTSLNLSRFNTENVTDMSQMFSSCTALTSLDLSSFNTENVTYMSQMFSSCTALTSLDLSRFNTKNVTDMGLMFWGCTALTSLDLSNFNTENVTNMYDMFSKCASLTSLDLSSFNLKNVTDMGYMFYDCTALTSLVLTRALTSFNPENVTDMQYMFYGCTALTSLDLSSFNTENVTNMRSMFQLCTSLTSLELSSFNTENVTSMREMFCGCASLTSLDLRSFNTESVTDMSVMFYGCTSLTSLDLRSFNTEKVGSMGSMFQLCTSLTSLDLRSFNTEKVRDMDRLFCGCASLTSLDLRSFNTERVTDMLNMFAGCTALTSLNLTSFNTENVTDMRNMFKGCSDLAEIYVSKNFTVENVTKSDEMFLGCTKLRYYDENYVDKTRANLVRGYGYLQLGKIAAGTPSAAYCEGDKSFHFLVSDSDLVLGSKLGSNEEMITMLFEVEGEVSQDYYTTWSSIYHTPIGEVTKVIFEDSFKNFKPTSCCYWFDDFSSLKEIEGFQNLNTENVTDMGYMFYGCKALTSLDLSSFNTENVTYMGYMFGGCASLTSLDLSSFNTENVTYMIAMFYNCMSLTSLDLSRFNTKNVTNMGGMFYGCNDLRLIDLSQATTSNFTNYEIEIPENALTYVPAGTPVTEGRANVVVGDKCESLVLNGAEHQLLLKVPYKFTADKVTVKRSFTEDQPYTLYLPFEMNVADYGTFYTGGELNEGGDMVKFTKVTEAQTTADIPYMFIPNADFSNGITIEGPVAVTNLTGETEADGLNGVYEKKEFTADEAAQRYTTDGQTVNSAGLRREPRWMPAAHTSRCRQAPRQALRLASRSSSVVTAATAPQASKLSTATPTMRPATTSTDAAQAPATVAS